MQGYRPRRRPSDKRVTITAQGRRHEVALLDVSDMGLKIACPEPLPPDASVEVSTPRLARQGRVRWAERGAAGLVLSEPLSAEEQAELSGMTWGY